MDIVNIFIAMLYRLPMGAFLVINNLTESAHSYFFIPYQCLLYLYYI